MTENNEQFQQRDSFRFSSRRRRTLPEYLTLFYGIPSLYLMHFNMGDTSEETSHLLLLRLAPSALVIRPRGHLDSSGSDKDEAWKQNIVVWWRKCVWIQDNHLFVGYKRSSPPSSPVRIEHAVPWDRLYSSDFKIHCPVKSLKKNLSTLWFTLRNSILRSLSIHWLVGMSCMKRSFNPSDVWRKHLFLCYAPRERFLQL